MFLTEMSWMEKALWMRMYKVLQYKRIGEKTMADEGKKYVVHGMYAQCSMGTMKNYLNTDVGHGVVYQGQPLLNANDHAPQINLTHFGDCNSKMIFEAAKKQADEKYKAEVGDNIFERVGKSVAKNVTKAAVTVQGCFGVNKCQLDTPLPWRSCNEEHMIDGAPALTVGSICPCKFGGIISIVEVPEPEAELSAQEAGGAAKAAKAPAAMAAAKAAAAAAEATAAAEQAAYVDMMGASYGFQKDQALLIQNAYKLSKEKKKSTHDFVSNMAGLCRAYGGSTLFGVVDGIPSVESSQKYFMKVGLSEQEVSHLTEAVNKQHRGGFRANAKEEKDFAHEMAVYAGYFNDKSLTRLAVLDRWEMQLVAGDMNKLNSYKGDVYSASMGIDDMNTDMDALNIYKSYMEDTNQDFFETMTEYNKGVIHKKINRAGKFLENFKGDNEEQKFEHLKKDLNSVRLGEWYLKKDIDPKKVQDTKDQFLNYIDKVRKEKHGGDEKKPE